MFDHTSRPDVKDYDRYQTGVVASKGLGTEVEQVRAMGIRWRPGLIVLLVGVVLVSGVHYDIREEHYREQPTTDEILTEYDRHVDERTLLFGTVEAVDSEAETATIRVDDTEPTTIQVRELEADVDRGGTVQIYGMLRSGHRIDADEVVVVDRGTGVAVYKYGISAVGALVILAGFFRDWRFDPSRLAFVPRSEDDG